MSPRPRDPDLGRDRDTKALGRRDWNWYQPYNPASGDTPADVETAQPPWAGHQVTTHDRHDRTLGIPPRHISMWPDQPSTLDSPGSTPRRTAAQIADDLRWLLQPPPAPSIAADRLAAALTDLAARLYGEPTVVQDLVIIQVGNQHGIDCDQLADHARGVGDMIAKTTHRSTRDLPGEPALNALAGTNLSVAAELYLARARLARATTCSDPDLPRLWMLANALTHHIPAHTILTTPARSHGLAARLRPTHDDLVGWRGIAAAVAHLNDTLEAIRRGRHWLATAADSATNRLLALGILDLTHPTDAARLAARGPAGVDLTDIRMLATRTRQPAQIADLTDPALKAVCDRNGWLHGTADERTDRELIERTTVSTADQRAQLATSDAPAALAHTVLGHAPSDRDLDRRTWRNQPAATDAVHRRHLLDIASREAIHRFAGTQITPRASKAEAIAGRFPDRIAQRALRVTEAELTTGQDPPPPPRLPAQNELDLGL